VSGKKEEGIKIVAENRKARHNYFIEDHYEAGIVLHGTEVKSLRAGKANLQDGYAIFKNDELWLINVHIPPYAMGNRENQESLRTRKLLMRRSELDKIWARAEIKGNSLVPLKIYFKKGLAKVEIGIGKGKKQYDKRATTKDREMNRELDRARRSTR